MDRIDIPSRYPTAHRPFALPEIYIQNSTMSDRKMMSRRSSSSGSQNSPPSSSIPMSIPYARDDDYLPPPLPPPRFIGNDAAQGSGGSVDPGWAWSNSRNENQSWDSKVSSVKPGSSLYGSFSTGGNSFAERFEQRRGSTANTIKPTSNINGSQSPYPRLGDEGYASLSTGTSMSSFQSKHEATAGRAGFQSSMHDRYRTDTGNFDRGMLDKLNSRKRGDTPSNNYGKGPFSTSLNDNAQQARYNRYASKPQQPLSMPAMPSKVGFGESPVSRWGEGAALSTTPLSSGMHFGYRSPGDRDDLERSPHMQSRHSAMDFDDAASSMSVSYQGSHFADEADFPMEETGLQRLRIDDNMRRSDGNSPTSAAGQKRRACSPPQDDGHPLLHTATSMNDLHRRRESLASRASPVPSRQHSLHGSISSTRSASFCSVPSLVPSSSMSAVDSYGRLSPGGISPGGLSPRTTDSGDSPYSSTYPLSNSQQEPMRTAQRPIPEVRPIASAKRAIENLSSSKNGVLKVQSGYVCDCCPKKPKKFDTEAALNAHELEKQYECAYCKNRFKNKNEAERHQNSLHLRRHSWSCAALADFGDAFHVSATSPSQADTCGYCGDEFPRSGNMVFQNGLERAQVTEHDWNTRVKHLVDVHKFRECNHTKKFFRADHFRQHLKHSHAGTSGKWTNMLENACMKDEPLPEPIRGPEIIRLGGLNGRVGRINEEEE